MSHNSFEYSSINSINNGDNKNKIYIEENYKNINYPNRVFKPENDEFIPPNREIKWNNILQNTYHFNHDIERVWALIKNFEILSILSDKGHYPCINIKGKDTSKIGNTFKGNLFGEYPFIARVEKLVNIPEIKEIKWLFNCLNNNCYFFIRIRLFKVTEDNSTVLLKETKSEKILTNLENKKDELNSLELFKKIDEILEKETINLLKYESGIIKGKMQDIYNVTFDYNKLSAIAPNNNLMPDININNLKIGEKKRVSIIKNEEIKNCDIILKCKDINPGWNKWMLAFEVSGREPRKIPKHHSLFQLTKINNEECQFIILTKYHEPISCQDFNEFTKKKKYLIKSLKDYFENFYSPDSSN